MTNNRVDPFGFAFDDAFHDVAAVFVCAQLDEVVAEHLNELDLLGVPHLGERVLHDLVAVVLHAQLVELPLDGLHQVRIQQLKRHHLYHLLNHFAALEAERQFLQVAVHLFDETQDGLFRYVLLSQYLFIFQVFRVFRV